MKRIKSVSLKVKVNLTKMEPIYYIHYHSKSQHGLNYKLNNNDIIKYGKFKNINELYHLFFKSNSNINFKLINKYPYTNRGLFTIDETVQNEFEFDLKKYNSILIQYNNNEIIELTNDNTFLYFYTYFK